jgi:hypothetical protein
MISQPKHRKSGRVILSTLSEDAIHLAGYQGNPVPRIQATALGCHSGANLEEYSNARIGQDVDINVAVLSFSISVQFSYPFSSGTYFSVN